MPGPRGCGWCRYGGLAVLADRFANEEADGRAEHEAEQEDDEQEDQDGVTYFAEQARCRLNIDVLSSVNGLGHGV